MPASSMNSLHLATDNPHMPQLPAAADHIACTGYADASMPQTVTSDVRNLPSCCLLALSQQPALTVLQQSATVRRRRCACWFASSAASHLSLVPFPTERHVQHTDVVQQQQTSGPYCPPCCSSRMTSAQSAYCGGFTFVGTRTALYSSR